MTDDSRRLQRTYDQIAFDYAQTNAMMPAAYQEHVGPEFLRLAKEGASAKPWPEPLRLLDVGCGPGRDVEWFRTHGASTVGADLSSGMLAQARTRRVGPLV